VGESDPLFLLLVKIAVGIVFLYGLARLYAFLGRYERSAVKPIASPAKEPINLTQEPPPASDSKIKLSPTPKASTGLSGGIELTEEFSKALALVQNGKQNLFVTGRGAIAESW
jgi:hypothetical protein